MPPVGACRYGCGTSCAAPITVFWIFGIISVIFGLLGGPTGVEGISWYTVGLGIIMWGIAAVWSMLTADGIEADRCDGSWSPANNKANIINDESDPFEEINKHN